MEHIDFTKVRGSIKKSSHFQHPNSDSNLDHVTDGIRRVFHMTIRHSRKAYFLEKSFLIRIIIKYQSVFCQSSLVSVRGIPRNNSSYI